MKIALLCGGPSLTTIWPEYSSSGYTLVVGVNTAAWLYPCDWCCCADKHIVDGFSHYGRQHPVKGFITHRAMPLPDLLAFPLARVLMPLGLQANPHGDLRCRYTLPHGAPDDACAYSFPNALAFCQAQGESGGVKPRIDIFGFDCSPSPVDVAGVEGQHHPKRWEQELPWVKHSWGHNCRVYSTLPLAVQRWLDTDGADSSHLWMEAVNALAPHDPKQ